MSSPPAKAPPDLARLDWNLLRCFAAVTEHGSITLAAERLGMSQPTLSRHIAALEDCLGASLFERTGRRLRPTALAQAMQEPIDHMAAAVNALAPLAIAQRDGLAGTVRISASEVVAALQLPPLLAELAERHPEIDIELIASNRVDNLLEREADIAVRMVAPRQGAVIARHLADWPLGFYAHPDYLARHGGAPGPTQIIGSGHRWIGMDRSFDLIDGFRAAGVPVDRQFFGLRCDNLIVNWQAMCAGVGIGLATSTLAASRPELVRVLPQQALPTLPVWLVAHGELRSSLRLRLVFDFLAQALAALPH
jgi:DNA-binding transcriptional LysR family regulator